MARLGCRIEQDRDPSVVVAIARNRSPWPGRRVAPLQLEARCTHVGREHPAQLEARRRPAPLEERDQSCRRRTAPEVEQHRDRGRPRIRDHEIGPPVAVPVADRDRLHAGAHPIVLLRAEGSVAVPEEDRDPPREHRIEGVEGRAPVAVPIPVRGDPQEPQTVEPLPRRHRVVPARRDDVGGPAGHADRRGDRREAGPHGRRQG